MYTIPLSDGLFATCYGILLLGSEISTSLGTYELYLRKARNKKMDLSLPRMPESWYPDVDVFIATHNEDPDLLYKTVNACVNFDYPDKSKVHIYLCDDGNRQTVARLAEAFGVGYLGLANNKEAKSGNYNNAIAHTSSPLIATFDADMIGQHTFLMETVPYFYLPYLKRGRNGEWIPRAPEEIDPNYKIGLIQTPQSFYNPDLFQFNLYAERFIPNEQDFFSREINVMRNSNNAIAYTGSNTVISRQALAEIGNFPTDTITEDFETGLKIQAAGYTCYATDKVQAAGLTVTTVKSMVTQRVRWARGVIQSVRNCKVPFNRNLTLSARWSYMSCFTYWWSFFQRLIFTFSPILFALFDIRIAACTVEQLALIWLPSYIFYLIAERFSSSSIRNQRWNQIIDTVMAPYMVIPVFLETIGIQQKKFKVTDKKRKQSGNTPYIIPHLIILGLSVAALVRFVSGKSGVALLYGAFIMFWLLYNIVSLVFAVFFMLGRPSQRSSERFKARIPLRVSYEGGVIETVTEDISEGGLSFTLPQPVFLPERAPMDMQLETNRYRVRLKAQLLYVGSEADAWRYRCSVVSMDEPDWRQYLQLIYDRLHSLPTRMDKWMTTVDSLLNNQEQRMREHHLERRTAPRVSIGRAATFEEGGQCIVVDFNYHHLLVSDLAFDGDMPDTLTIALEEGIRIRCKPEEGRKRKPGTTLLRVINEQDLINNRAFLRALIRWSSGDETAAGEAARQEEASA
ncbi:MAG TPA: glycosyltransferase [Clostridia bacterium]|nr:glycosyltransferase [Clostridia bacterium]